MYESKESLLFKSSIDRRNRESSELSFEQLVDRYFSDKFPTNRRKRQEESSSKDRSIPCLVGCDTSREFQIQRDGNSLPRGGEDITYRHGATWKSRDFSSPRLELPTARSKPATAAVPPAPPSSHHYPLPLPLHRKTVLRLMSSQLRHLFYSSQ